MTMLPRSKDLLPSYLDGSNVDRHCDLVDEACKSVLDRLSLLESAFSLERPIVYGSTGVLLQSSAPILEVRVTVGGSTSTTEFDAEDMVLSYTVNSVPVSGMRVSFDTVDGVTFSRAFGELDEYLENIGKLLGLPRKSGEYDDAYIQRLEYFISHYGSDDLALLMLKSLYGVEASSVYRTTGKLHQYIIRQWDSQWSELQQFSEKYCPITRPLIVVPPITRLQLKSFNTTSFTFKPDYPEEIMCDVHPFFRNLTANKYESLEWHSGNYYPITTTSIMDAGTGSFPIRSYLTYVDDEFGIYYLLIIKAMSYTSVLWTEFYSENAAQKVQIIEQTHTIPDEWFVNPEYTTYTSLSASSSSITAGSSVVLSASVTKRDSTALTRGELTLYDGSTLVDTATITGATTTFTVTPTLGSHSYHVEYEDTEEEYYDSISDNVSVTVTKQASSISTNVNNISTTYGSSTSITGVLSIGGTGQSGITVKLLDYDDCVLSSTTTTTNGTFTFNYTANNLQTSGHSIQVVYEGSSTVEASSKSIPVTINRQSSSITTSVDSISLIYGESTSITGTLAIGGTGTSGLTVKLLDYDDTVLDSTTTGSGGSFTFNYTANNMSTSGHNIRVFYEGTTTVSDASKNIAVTVNKQSSSISTSSDTLSLVYGQTGTISGTFKVAGTGQSGMTVKLLDYDGTTVLSTATTSTGGAFTFNYTANNMSASGHDLTVKYEGSSTTNSSTKTIALAVQKRTSSISVTGGTGEIYYGSSTTITGTLSIEGTGVSGETVYLKNGSTTLATATTSGGAFSISYTPSSWDEDGNQLVVYPATSTTLESSANAHVRFKRHDTSITLASNSLTLYYGSTGTISGTFKVDNTGTSGATIVLRDYQNNTLATTTTGSGGSFSFNYTANDWSLSGTDLYVEYDRTDYNKMSSESVALTLQRHTTSLSVADVTGAVGDTVNIVVTAKDESNNNVTEGTVTVEVTPQSNNS